LGDKFTLGESRSTFRLVRCQNSAGDKKPHNLAVAALASSADTARRIGTRRDEEDGDGEAGDGHDNDQDDKDDHGSEEDRRHNGHRGSSTNTEDSSTRYPRLRQKNSTDRTSNAPSFAPVRQQLVIEIKRESSATTAQNSGTDLTRKESFENEVTSDERRVQQELKGTTRSS
jgi:hypothetical protein